MKNNKKERKDASEREDARVQSGSASHIPLAHFNFQEMSVQSDREIRLFSFSVIDKLINNLSLFLLDVNVYVSQTARSFLSMYSSQSKTERMTRDGDPINYRLRCVLNFFVNWAPQVQWSAGVRMQG